MGFSHGYGKVPEESYAVEAIRKAHDFGCTFFDTAEGYGKEQFYAGHNEELLGKALAPFRKEVVLATKFHIGEIASLKNVELYDAVRQHLEASMKRLQTDYVDLYYLHRLRAQRPCGVGTDKLWKKTGRRNKKGQVNKRFYFEGV